MTPGTSDQGSQNDSFWVTPDDNNNGGNSDGLSQEAMDIYNDLMNAG